MKVILLLSLALQASFGIVKALPSDAKSRQETAYELRRIISYVLIVFNYIDVPPLRSSNAPLPQNAVCRTTTRR